jgi:hypothetical protein
METPATRVTVARTLPIDVRQRQIILTLDGQPLATLLFGESVTREIEPGHHWIRANNTLVWKTLEFTAEAGDQVTFVTGNRAGFGTYTLLALLGTGPLYLVFERESSSPRPPAPSGGDAGR